jgi:uncharacterized protein (TIGR02058 family)
LDLNYRKYILEMGTGIDLHGEDVNEAAKRGVRDAITRVSMIGLLDIFGFRNMEELDDAVMVDVTVAAPYPEKINGDEILRILPEGRRRITVVSGGMRFPTAANVYNKDVHGVVVVNVALVVMVDMDKVRTK